MKKLLFVFLALGVTTGCIAQAPEWTVVNGKAQVQSVISVPGKDATQLYKQVHRWLLATFKNPEEMVKARVEFEYVRGVGYSTNIFQAGALSHLDFRYAFVIEMKDERVRLTLSKGVILNDNPQDINDSTPLEYYFNRLNKKKNDKHAREVITAVNTMTGTLLESLENVLLSEYVSSDDW
jgi:hypothetical protein